jgi:hypothetical protein
MFGALKTRDLHSKAKYSSRPDFRFDLRPDASYASRAIDTKKRRSGGRKLPTNGSREVDDETRAAAAWQGAQLVNNSPPTPLFFRICGF